MRTLPSGSGCRDSRVGAGHEAQAFHPRRGQFGTKAQTNSQTTATRPEAVQLMVAGTLLQYRLQHRQL